MHHTNLPPLPMTHPSLRQIPTPSVHPYSSPCTTYTPPIQYLQPIHPLPYPSPYSTYIHHLCPIHPPSILPLPRIRLITPIPLPPQKPIDQLNPHLIPHIRILHLKRHLHHLSQRLGSLHHYTITNHPNTSNAHTSTPPLSTPPPSTPPPSTPPSLPSNQKKTKHSLRSS